MKDHKVVSGEEWLRARKELLAREKEFTRLRDEVSRLRCDLPAIFFRKLSTCNSV